MSKVDFHDGNYLVHVRAQVMTRDDSTGGWVPMGEGGLSNVYVRKKIVQADEDAKYEYQIYGNRLSDQSVVLCCTIKKDFEYNMVMPTFHHWRTEDNKFGLTFQSAADAKSFRKGVATAMEDVLEVADLVLVNDDIDLGDDEVFMAVDLPAVDSRSSSGSSSAGYTAASTGIVRSSSATPNLMMHNNVNPIVVDPTTLSSSSPYTHPHGKHHHFHRMAFFRPPRTAPSTPNGNSSSTNQSNSSKSAVNSEQKITVKETEDLWIKQDDLTAHRSKSSTLKDNKEQILDCDKIEVLGDSYSYVQFSEKFPSRVDYSSHEYSYPVVDASCKNEKRSSISSIKKHNLDVTPPLLPSKGRRKKDKKRDRHKNNFLLDVSATNKCRNCGEYYREDENEVGTCKTPANDDNVKVCVERLTCIPAARCMLYHCVSDNEGDFNNENPCTCDPNKDSCGRRWAALSILSIFIPCLWCYLPLRCCYKIGLKNKLYGGRHAPQIKAPDESNSTNVMMDSNKDFCSEERYVT